MVSTIANGGTYLPPHVLMPVPVDASGQKPAAPQTPQPFKPGGDLPNPLPPGAHRVISEMTAAQMRKMMEGVVLYGTGKEAQLNGYSSGGKTGTAQKIDPATHTYSKTMHVASFAGIAPVNTPVISVAVVIDNPKGASYYGAAVSAPVFADVAQQILEYLGIQHDIDVHAPRTTKDKSPLRVAEDDREDNPGDINALYAAANDLPADDPLRAAASQAVAQPVDQTTSQPATPQAVSSTKSSAAVASSESQTAKPPTQQTATVAVVEPKRFQVPSLIGLPVRKVVEQAAAAGLAVQIMGNGTVREQAPAPGTMVLAGTQIVVRCGR
jgi:cell division protein FtsI (penicillin-binding protein 3)